MPALFDAWVTRPRMVPAEPGQQALLTTEDLDGGGPLVSLLNAGTLDGICHAALTAPAGDTAGPFAFLATPLHLYLTASNLQGIPYEVAGATADDAYRMRDHADRLHFTVGQLGTAAHAASDWAGQDRNGTALSPAALAASAGEDPAWAALGQAALATAAFPAGLAARPITTDQQAYTNRLFPAPLFPGGRIEPAWPADPAPFTFVAADGGMIDNDPFEFARYALLRDWQDFDARNPRDPLAADRAVLMISPFPEPPAQPIPFGPETALTRVLAALFPTLLQQARFKLADIAAAADPNTASRWLIAPRGAKTPDASSANIACGALGGFGGFLDEEFRAHDFQLGRRNCQNFLRAFWTHSAFTHADGAPVLKLMGSAEPAIPLPEWPVMTQGDFRVLMEHIGRRAEAVLRAATAKLAWWQRLPARAAWVLFARRLLLARIRTAIAADLTARGQLEAI
jgi:hypothetical protein